MELSKIDNIIKGIKDKGLYDFISQEGYNLSKDELITIIKELDFATYENDKITHKIITDNMLKELKARA